MLGQHVENIHRESETRLIMERGTDETYKITDDLPGLTERYKHDFARFVLRQIGVVIRI